MNGTAASHPTDLRLDERLARLRLIRSEHVGPITYRHLLARFGTALEALDALPGLARRGGARREIKIWPKAEAEREWAATEDAGGQFLFLGDAGYPHTLAAIEDAPPVIVYRGNAHLLEKPMVAIVGARNASALGLKLTERLARDLGDQGFIVVSGLARGIDTAAHKGALATGTAAVMAGGVDVIYPPENEALYDELVARGVVLTEMPLATRPKAQHFPRRNRLVSGLSLGVVVTEAAPKSGSLITARLAGEQGREVFAVPGSPLDPRSKGANHLLRNGATLIETAEHVVEVLKPLVNQRLQEPEHPALTGAPAGPEDADALADARQLVRSMLGPSPVEIDELVRRSQLTVAIVSTILLELELAGHLDRQPGGRVALIADEPAVYHPDQ